VARKGSGISLLCKSWSAGLWELFWGTGFPVRAHIEWAMMVRVPDMNAQTSLEAPEKIQASRALSDFELLLILLDWFRKM
jgi:hypothetical protein